MYDQYPCQKTLMATIGNFSRKIYKKSTPLESYFNTLPYCLNTYIGHSSMYYISIKIVKYWVKFETLFKKELGHLCTLTRARTGKWLWLSW